MWLIARVPGPHASIQWRGRPGHVVGQRVGGVDGEAEPALARGHTESIGVAQLAGTLRSATASAAPAAVGPFRIPRPGPPGTPRACRPRIPSAGPAAGGRSTPPSMPRATPCGPGCALAQPLLVRLQPASSRVVRPPSPGPPHPAATKRLLMSIAQPRLFSCLTMSRIRASLCRRRTCAVPTTSRLHCASGGGAVSVPVDFREIGTSS